jgi:CRP-like cAMP-binding protein
MAFSIDKYYFNSEIILEDLPADELNLLKENSHRLDVKKGKIIFREGTFSKGVYIIRKGKVKIYQTTKVGRESVVYIFRKGEIFGYRPLLCDENHPTSGTTLEDCSFTFISKKHFLQMLDRSPVFSRRLLINLSHEFSVLINQISVFAQQPVRERVALALRILNEKYKREGKEVNVAINLSRNDIANYVGTSTETLVRVLRNFKDEKIIRTEGRKIIVLKPKELEKIAEFY